MILENGDGAQADDDDDDAHLPLSLSLGQTSNPSPNTTALLRLAPPSHVVPPMRPHDFMARLASRGSSTPMQPPLLKYFLPSLGYIPSSNQTPARPVMRTITSKVESRRSFYIAVQRRYYPAAVSMGYEWTMYHTESRESRIETDHNHHRRRTKQTLWESVWSEWLWENVLLRFGLTLNRLDASFAALTRRLNRWLQNRRVRSIGCFYFWDKPWVTVRWRSSWIFVRVPGPELKIVCSTWRIWIFTRCFSLTVSSLTVTALSL